MANNNRLAIAFAATGGAALLLAGCSKASAVVSRCVQDGEAREVCTCMAETTEKAVDPHMFQVIVLAAEGKGDQAQALYNSLPADIQLAGSQAARAAREQCKSRAPKPPPPIVRTPGPSAPPPPPAETNSPVTPPT